jgi:hypothetical protein
VRLLVWFCTDCAHAHINKTYYGVTLDSRRVESVSLRVSTNVRHARSRTRIRVRVRSSVRTGRTRVAHHADETAVSETHDATRTPARRCETRARLEERARPVAHTIHVLIARLTTAYARAGIEPPCPSARPRGRARYKAATYHVRAPRGPASAITRSHTSGGAQRSILHVRYTRNTLRAHVGESSRV